MEITWCKLDTYSLLSQQTKHDIFSADYIARILTLSRTGNTAIRLDKYKFNEICNMKQPVGCKSKQRYKLMLVMFYIR